jgi:type II secretory pathway component PulF
LVATLKMPEASLDEFIAFNDQLAALVEADVPLELGLDVSTDRAPEALEKINALVARRVSQRASMAAALDSAELALPPQYRGLMQLWVHTGEAEGMLDQSNHLAEEIDDSRHGVRSGLFYPLLVCVLALTGMIAFCLYLVPRLESFRQDLRVPAGFGLRAMHALQVWMPYWAVAAGVILALAAWRIWSTRSRRTPNRFGLWERLTEVSSVAFQQRAAAFADSLANLLSAGVPLAEGLRIASAACGDPRLESAARSLADASMDDAVPKDNAGRQLPPFLRWALLQSEPAVDRASALRMAASVYRQSAARLSDRARLLVRLAATVLLGGAAVLLYGLALFTPLTEMLRAISALN